MKTAEERDLVQLFVDDLTDYAIVTLDVNGTVLTWNAGARDLLGYTSNEVIGRRLSNLYSKSDALTGKSNASLKDALQWGRHETTARLAHKDGTKFDAQIILRPLSDSWNRFVGFGMLAYTAENSADASTDSTEAEAEKIVSLPLNAKILVVDDNDGVLEEAVEQLTSLGYGVVSASNGAAALEVLERDPDIDLLFTDVVMPGSIGGRALAEKAMQMRPGLKVLFASGYFEGALVGKGALETDVQFLTKPYIRRELAKKIEEALTAGS
jgi:PAS domain S-box-containing protein